ncbi:hypothetical protein V8G54_027057 [Vigna mungo]|uniref:Uncharacterized protein n=1 Tax=Vigna mungo TaxID=3915 RepID=A0AAQ3N1R5_VIGMU
MMNRLNFTSLVIPLYNSSSVQGNLRSIGGALGSGFWYRVGPPSPDAPASAAGSTRAFRVESKNALLWGSLKTSYASDTFLNMDSASSLFVRFLSGCHFMASLLYALFRSSSLASLST